MDKQLKFSLNVCMILELMILYVTLWIILIEMFVLNIGFNQYIF
jgi:hypothetical protein